MGHESMHKASMMSLEALMNIVLCPRLIICGLQGTLTWSLH